MTDLVDAVQPDRDAVRPRRPGHRRRWPFIGALVVGLGLIAAPSLFQMHDRAPKGRDMIDEFRPYMDERTIGGFQHDLRTIDAAVAESRTALDGAGLGDAEVADQYPLLHDLHEQWPAIDADMGDMLTTMRGDIGNFQAVDDLPPFQLFPWFFIVPGVLISATAVAGLVQVRRDRSTRVPALVLGVLGAALVIAPGVFQMVDRAPKGGTMIDDFRPLMTREKVQRIQGYFLVIGGGEGTLRTQVIPALAGPGTLSAAEVAAQFPAISRFSEDWPATSNQMAPMIGAMSDNLDNYSAVAALPPFPLFPLFFVVPGLLLVALAWQADRELSVATAPDHPTGEIP